jgi:uncharacterized protein (UPF0335 family)
MSNVSAALQQYLDRLDNIEVERQACVDAAKQVLAEAKGEGFDPKVLRQLASARRTEGKVEQLRTVVNLSDNLDLLGDADE